MDKKTERIIAFSFLAFLVLAAIVGFAAPYFIMTNFNENCENLSRPFFASNEEIKKEIGEVVEYECLGRAAVGDKDGLPICFSVKAEKKDCYVILWVLFPSDNSREWKLIKHLVTDDIPKDFF